MKVLATHKLKKKSRNKKKVKEINIYHFAYSKLVQSLKKETVTR